MNYKLTFLYILLLLSFHGFSQKIKVLNIGTFHMSGTSDSHKFDYAVKNKKKQSETLRIAQMIANFKPTITCVEREIRFLFFWEPHILLFK